MHDFFFVGRLVIFIYYEVQLKYTATLKAVPVHFTQNAAAHMQTWISKWEPEGTNTTKQKTENDPLTQTKLRVSS